MACNKRHQDSAATSRLPQVSVPDKASKVKQANAAKTVRATKMDKAPDSAATSRLLRASVGSVRDKDSAKVRDKDKGKVKDRDKGRAKGKARTSRPKTLSLLISRVRGATAMADRMASAARAVDKVVARARVKGKVSSNSRPTSSRATKRGKTRVADATVALARAGAKALPDAAARLAPPSAAPVMWLVDGMMRAARWRAQISWIGRTACAMWRRWSTLPTCSDRARVIRKEFLSTGARPDWAVVKTQISTPLAEVRNRVDEELARRASKEALVPLDRDPVPVQFSERVKRYYEELGKSE